MLFDPLDYVLPPPHRVYHYADQDFLERLRIQAWEALNLPPAAEQTTRAQARHAQKAERLESIAQGCWRVSR